MSSIPKKKGKRKWRIPVIVVAVLAAIILIPRFLSPTHQGSATAPASTSNLRSATAETGSITSAVSGSGTLKSADAEEITVPSGVEIDTVFVSAGDQVVQGALLATVDRNSVLTALADIQSQLDDLDEELKDKADDKVSANVKAGVSGRVKLIYAEVGDGAAAVTARCGGLLVLSLDGKMAVTLPISDAVGIGDDVTVTLPDGSTEDGTVSEYTSDGMVVTLTDNGPVYGDTVSVTAKDEVDLGSGALYIHSPLTVTGYTGTVSSVKVKENEKVSASTVLIKLSDLGHTAEYNALLAQREELTGQIQTLTALYQNNTLTAPFDGTVQSVTSDAETTVSADASASAYAAGYSGFSMPTVSASRITLQSAPTTSEGSEQTPAEPAEAAQPQQPAEPLQPDQPVQPDQPAGTVSVPLVAAVTLTGGQMADYAGQFTLTLTGDGVSQEKVNDANGIVTFDPLAFGQSGTYLYQLTQKAGTDSSVRYDTETVYTIIIQVAAGADGKLTASVLPDTATLIFSNTIGTEQPAQAPSGGGDPSSAVIPDDLGDLSGYTGGSAVNFSGTGGLSGLSGVSGLSGTSVDTDSLAQAAASASSGSVSETTVLTLSPNDHMTVSVSVDELDILSVQKGQTASVTVDALGDVPISGTVTGIDTTGTASGGVTKYTIEVTIDKTEQMLANMNASVEIVIDKAENCLTIPEAALNQTGTRTFVYTGYDEATGTPSGEVEVSTGVSDGTNVAITGGLSEGDTVYYIYNDAGNAMNFGFYGGGPMGGRPGGQQ